MTKTVNIYRYLIKYSKINILGIHKELVKILYPLFDKIVKDMILYIMLKYLLLIIFFESKLIHNSYIKYNIILST